MNISRKLIVVRFGALLLALAPGLGLAQTTRPGSTAPVPAVPSAPAESTPLPLPLLVYPQATSRAAGGGEVGESYGAAYGGGGFGSTTSYRSSSAKETVPPILLQFDSADPVASQHLEEDLTIMSHILDQALERGLGEDTPPSKMGVPLTYTSGSRSSRALYLAGVGPVFMIKVNMALMAAPPAPEKASHNPVDNEWESARREVIDNGGKNTLTIATAAPDSRFDAEQVEALQQTLLGALKNASNIRGLKPDDFVTIAVFGQPMPVSIVTIETRGTQNSATDHLANGQKVAARGNKSSRKSSTGTLISAPNLPPVAQRGTVLTMRAKIADVHEFAQGKSDAEAFAKKVTTTTYAGAGYGITSLNSWLQSGRAANQVR